eukprot:gene4035-8033_t
MSFTLLYHSCLIFTFKTTSRTLSKLNHGTRRYANPTTTYNSGIKNDLSSITILGAYNKAYKSLVNANISEPEDSARLLVSDAAEIGYRRSSFYKNQDNVLSLVQMDIVDKHVNRRLQQVPVQYIIGNWDFYGFTLKCNPPVLIPRPETEELVERILSSKILQNIESPRILDIGAGSGAIGIALLTQLPRAQCTALDISATATSLANDNAVLVLKENTHRYKCIHQSFHSYYMEMASSKNMPKYDLIVSNPPYIPTNEMETLDLEVRLYEDKLALDGGIDGLDIVREIIELSPNLLRSDGPREVWMEVSSSHPEHLQRCIDRDEEFMRNCLDYKWYEDLAGKPRFIRYRSRHS